MKNLKCSPEDAEKNYELCFSALCGVEQSRNELSVLLDIPSSSLTLADAYLASLLYYDRLTQSQRDAQYLRAEKELNALVRS